MSVDSVPSFPGGHVSSPFDCVIIAKTIFTEEKTDCRRLDPLNGKGRTFY
jgi:hypothetical protein